MTLNRYAAKADQPELCQSCVKAEASPTSGEFHIGCPECQTRQLAHWLEFFYRRLQPDVYRAALAQLPLAHAAKRSEVAETRLRAPQPLTEKGCATCDAVIPLSRTFCGGCISAQLAERNAKRVLVGPPKPDTQCLGCGSMFIANNPRRKFCTYECHLRSGGARRAGDAAARAKMKYGAKKDANHGAIFEEIRKHCVAHDTSNAGCGIPDGIAWVDGAWRLFDVKNPQTAYGRRGLNKRQTEWAGLHGGGPIYLLYTVEDAAKFGRGEFADLKSAGGGPISVVTDAEGAVRAARAIAG